MTDPVQDREIERRRYNDRAAVQVSTAGTRLGPDGAESIDLVLRRPYLVYEDLIRVVARPGLAVLDVCCGTGRHSLTAALHGADVTASDIAENNLDVVRQRAARAGVLVKTLAADSEEIPLPAQSFELITCAGSLSYVDLDRFVAEMHRLLRPGGAFVFVDSLNHNPIYRINRYVHYLRGHRSRSTLQRMPTLATLDRIRTWFPDLHVSFHGIFSFLAPALRKFGETRAAKWLDRLDVALPALNRYAFKVVGIGHRRLG